VVFTGPAEKRGHRVPETTTSSLGRGVTGHPIPGSVGRTVGDNHRRRPDAFWVRRLASSGVLPDGAVLHAPPHLHFLISWRRQFAPDPVERLESRCRAGFVLPVPGIVMHVGGLLPARLEKGVCWPGKLNSSLLIATCMSQAAFPGVTWHRDLEGQLGRFLCEGGLLPGPAQVSRYWFGRYYQPCRPSPNKTGLGSMTGRRQGSFPSGRINRGWDNRQKTMTLPPRN